MKKVENITKEEIEQAKQEIKTEMQTELEQLQNELIVGIAASSNLSSLWMLNKILKALEGASADSYTCWMQTNILIDILQVKDKCSLYLLKSFLDGLQDC